MSEKQKLNRVMTGVVVSDKMDKTIVVKIERRIKHPIGKYIKRSTKISAHDESNQSAIGDLVQIQECRPMSKNKSWKLLKIVESNQA
jgi:small subunit ribosomal protein S17